MRPLLVLHEDGGEHAVSDSRESLAQQFELTPEDRAERLPSGTVPTLQNRVGWATTYLFRTGLLERPRRAQYRITPRGRQILQTNPDRVDLKILEQFRELHEFVGTAASSGQSSAPAADSSQQTGTPEERMAAAEQEVKDALAAELLDRILEAGWEKFEELVLEVLKAMGYGGPEGSAERIGGHGADGGVDGVIREDKLGLEEIYVQAKAWKQDRAVRRPDVQSFVGALQGESADKGVFITTSRFTPDAKQYVEQLSARVKLVDGRRLAEYMIEYDVGVTRRQKFEIKAVDVDYFEPDAD